jgi:hypothetical protein
MRRIGGNVEGLARAFRVAARANVEAMKRRGVACAGLVRRGVAHRGFVDDGMPAPSP